MSFPPVLPQASSEVSCPLSPAIPSVELLFSCQTYHPIFVEVPKMWYSTHFWYLFCAKLHIFRTWSKISCFYRKDLSFIKSRRCFLPWRKVFLPILHIMLFDKIIPYAYKQKVPPWYAVPREAWRILLLQRYAFNLDFPNVFRETCLWGRDFNAKSSNSHNFHPFPSLFSLKAWKLRYILLYLQRRTHAGPSIRRCWYKDGWPLQ